MKEEKNPLNQILSKQIIGYNYSGRSSKAISYIVIHDTGNKRSGADARAHQKYFGSGNKNASAHYLVDSRQIIQIIEDSMASWHCGDGYGKKGISNQNSIGIELCINSDGDYRATLSNAASLVRALMKQYKIPRERLVRHYDASGKICPASMSANKWAKWKDFKDKIGENSPG